MYTDSIVSNSIGNHLFTDKKGIFTLNPAIKVVYNCNSSGWYGQDNKLYFDGYEPFPKEDVDEFLKQ
ncbi:MAG TPA: hypothetical protein VGF30_02165 [Bacteroidia bacterium]